MEKKDQGLRVLKEKAMDDPLILILSFQSGLIRNKKKILVILNENFTICPTGKKSLTLVRGGCTNSPLIDTKSIILYLT